MAHRKVSHICAVVGFLAFVAFPDESWGGGLVGAAAVPGLVFDEGVGVEVTTSSGSSEEAIILPYPRKGVRRSIVGFMILSLALLHFYFKTYPKIFPKYKKALLYGQNIAAQLAGEEPVSEAEYNVQRYVSRRPPWGLQLKLFRGGVACCECKGG